MKPELDAAIVNTRILLGSSEGLKLKEFERESLERLISHASETLEIAKEVSDSSKKSPEPLIVALRGSWSFEQKQRVEEDLNAKGFSAPIVRVAHDQEIEIITPRQDDIKPEQAKRMIQGLTEGREGRFKISQASIIEYRDDICGMVRGSGETLKEALENFRSEFVLRNTGLEEKEHDNV